MSIHIKKPNCNNAKAVVIWLHGLGADGNDMIRVVDAFQDNLPIVHIFVDAPIRPVTINNNMPMRAWYNISGMQLTDREDLDGILASEKIINDIIESQVKEGFSYQQIFLAGFSQGGALALFISLRNQHQIGGCISLSAYLPCVAQCSNTYHPNLPIFMAMGEFDLVVQPAWTKASYSWIRSKYFVNLTWKQYPMAHNICIEEINDISFWLNERIKELNYLGEKQ
ncbi:MAG: hypothetical protein A3E88_03060 [Legionellales bacterium RIFCSPHIGHO2_12_FULL_35_11]|nr:MAG: hypothetical protein A3E88_03060 [Legionellales bacterium RIFCSPHIGHO2_12_FULL_35_11]